jgi:hypothetical protein
MIDNTIMFYIGVEACQHSLSSVNPERSQTPVSHQKRGAI